LKPPLTPIKSLRGKLFAGVLLSSIVALLLTCGALFAYDLHTYRKTSAADLAVQAEHEIKSVAGAAFLPYPPEFQRTIEFVGGIGTASQDVPAAKAYLQFITGPVAAAAIAAHHLTPG